MPPHDGAGELLQASPGRNATGRFGSSENFGIQEQGEPHLVSIQGMNATCKRQDLMIIMIIMHPCGQIAKIHSRVGRHDGAIETGGAERRGAGRGEVRRSGPAWQQLLLAGFPARRHD